jgi:nucleoside phosphorylase
VIEMNEAKEYDYHVALITVTETEEAGLRRMHDVWHPMLLDGDDQPYYETSFTRDSETFKVVTARPGEMGMTAAGILTMKMIAHFRPKYVIMVGIAAGVAHNNALDQIYGDVVVPNIVWDYSSGKFVSSARASVTFGDIGFIPRPHFINTDESILHAVQQAKESPENECHVHIGPMACGSTVVANREIVEKQIHSQYGDTAALDMESYAVMYAVKEAPAPQPKGLVIKSVCDYANEEKSDQYQKFAAFTSAQFAKFLYEGFLK